MHKHPRVRIVSSRDGNRCNDRCSAKSTSTRDLPPIQFVIHADPETICKCCGSYEGQNRDQVLEPFCRQCCGKYQENSAGEVSGPIQENKPSAVRLNDAQHRYPTIQDFGMQTDECQTHFHKHLYNASLLQKYCGGNIFAPLEMSDEDAKSESAEEDVVEEITNATQTDESEFPKVKLVRVLSNAETQTQESLLSQLASQFHEGGNTMKHVNTSLTMIRSPNPFLYNFSESDSFEEMLQPYCYCQSVLPSNHTLASPSGTQKSLSTIYQLPPEKKKRKYENQTFMACFKRKKDKKNNV